MPKEPTRHQLSSRLAYSQGTPAFLQRLKNQVAGVSDSAGDNDENDFDSWEGSSGRPPIPRRPTPPSRPEGDPGSADEDGDDEKPQVVVLKEGKHLTAEEVENEKRKAMGLPPLPKASDGKSGVPGDSDSVKANKSRDTSEPLSTHSKPGPLSFASTSSSSGPSNSKKRKLPDALQTLASTDLSKAQSKSKSSKDKDTGSKKKKAKKAGTLLSFGDGNDG